jgi:RimJ/RimL family protein N-acetyltransferase
MTANAASRRVLEKCGLVYVRTVAFHDPGDPIEGSAHGEVEYAVTRAEWEAQRAAAG